MKPILSCAVISLLLATAGPVRGQTILPKPTFSKPTVLVGPATLSANPTKGKITLTFAPVANAVAYRVTRGYPISNPTKGVEVTIYEAPAPGTFDPDNKGVCHATVAYGYCQYVDTKVTQSIVYTYRVWAIYQGPMLSQPSPSANATARW